MIREVHVRDHEVEGGRELKPYIIVLGNEKGGSGKSTTAMHIIMTLLDDGFEVASLDLDPRQKTLSRYFENRDAFMESNNIDLLMPKHRVVARSNETTAEGAAADEQERFVAVLEELSIGSDVIVIDCPGSDSFLSRLAHSYADTLVTPMNDSFVDLDLLARVAPETLDVLGPSLYSEMVWDCRKKRAMRDKGAIDWIVVRNRIQSLDARNTRFVRQVLGSLSKRIGFRFVPGFGERVIYKELFLKGLTLVDLSYLPEDEVTLTMSQVAARNELRQLISALQIPGKMKQRDIIEELRETA